MKKAIIYFSLLAGTLLSMSSCKKYLDVRPEDKILKEEAFSKESGFMTQLNGVYLSMSSYEMYGGKMHMVIPDVLGQLYNTNGSSPYNNMSRYTYTDEKTKVYFADYWTNAYSGIANLNLILDNIDKAKNVFTNNNYNLVKGEALALRTFLHFDLMRLFGPIYASSDSATMSIPYYSYRSPMARPYVKGNDLMDSLQRDINLAVTLLASDPVLKYGPGGDSSANFTSYRKYRLNYYAVKALQARMYLYRLDKVNALAAAQEVLNAPAAYFPFNTTGSLPTDPALTKDCLFLLENYKLEDSYNKLFATSLFEMNILMPRGDALTSLFNQNADVRISPFRWNLPSDGSRTDKVFYKYSPVLNFQGNTNVRIPIIRAAECYLIAAEAAPDRPTQLQYLNKLKAARGADLIVSTNDFTGEITKEYRREFYGEGQMFFYYKRINAATIQDGIAAPGTMIAMGKTKYVVPLPDAERQIHLPNP